MRKLREKCDPLRKLREKCAPLRKLREKGVPLRKLRESDHRLLFRKGRARRTYGARRTLGVRCVNCAKNLWPCVNCDFLYSQRAARKSRFRAADSA